jgi:hypothetical protein
VINQTSISTITSTLGHMDLELIVRKNFDFTGSVEAFFAQRAPDAVVLYKNLEEKLLAAMMDAKRNTDFLQISNTKLEMIRQKADQYEHKISILESERDSLQKTLEYERDTSRETLKHERSTSQETLQYERDTSRHEREQSKMHSESWARERIWLEKEVLRVRGLLTSRGVFERMLQLVADENKVSGKFNATDVCMKLRTYKDDDSKPWTQKLLTAIQNGAPGRNVSEYACELYTILSKGVHGCEWTGVAVDIRFDSEKPDEAVHLEVLKSICKALGLQN